MEHSLQGSELEQDSHVQSFAATLLHVIYSGTPEPLPFDGFVDSVWPMYCKVLESQSEYYLSTDELLYLYKCADVNVIISENRNGAYYALATHVPFPNKRIVHTSVKNAELHFERLMSVSEYKMLLQHKSNEPEPPVYNTDYYNLLTNNKPPELETEPHGCAKAGEPEAPSKSNDMPPVYEAEVEAPSEPGTI